MKRIIRQQTISFFIICYLIVTIGCKKHSDSGVTPSDPIPGIVSTVSTHDLYFQPAGIAIGKSGNLFIADDYAHRIFFITPAGSIVNLAGSGNPGFSDGTGEEALFYRPSGLALDDSGNVYVADTGNNRIRKITPAGVVTTVAGSASGFNNGTGSNAQFNSPSGVAVDDSFNVYVADTGNNRIRKITSNGLVTTLAGNGQTLSNDGQGTLASFSQPHGVATDSLGNIYVADVGNNLIRKITPTGLVTTIAGNKQSGLKNSNALNSEFDFPTGIAIDKAGNIYVADDGNSCIRKMTKEGVVTTYAGGHPGSNDGAGSNGSFLAPQALAIDTLGNMYVADFGSFAIRKVIVK